MQEMTDLHRKELKLKAIKVGGGGAEKAASGARAGPCVDQDENRA